MKTRLITFLIFSIGISGWGQIQKPLSQYGTTNQLAPGDLIGVSVSPFSAKERVKGITAANLALTLGSGPTNGLTGLQVSNVVNLTLIASNLASAAKLIATTNGLQGEINALQAATNSHAARLAAIESSNYVTQTTATNMASNVVAAINVAAITNILAVSATLDFPSTGSMTNSDLSIAFNGGTTNDVAMVQVPPNMRLNNSTYSWWVTNGLIWIRYSNYLTNSAQDPPSGLVNAIVFKR